MWINRLIDFVVLGKRRTRLGDRKEGRTNSGQNDLTAECGPERERVPAGEDTLPLVDSDGCDFLQSNHNRKEAL